MKEERYLKTIRIENPSPPASPDDREAVGWRAREKGDDRILGSGEFVETILGNSNDTEPRRQTRISLELLAQKVASHFNLKEDDLRSPVKSKSIVEAKSAFGYIAIKQMGYSGREVGRFLNMRSYSAIRRAQEGKKILDKSNFLLE